MGKENTLSDTTGNLYKLSPKVVLYAQKRLGMLSTEGICKWSGSDELAYSKASLQIAMMAARAIYLEPSLIIAALQELAAFKHTAIPHHIPLHYPMPHAVAALWQATDIILVNCNGMQLDNLKWLLRSLDHESLLFALKYFYIPLAPRMQLYPIQTKSADFWLKQADEVSYHAISTKLGISKWQRQQKLGLLAEEVYAAVKRLRIDFEIKKRVKSIYSIWCKIQQRKIDFEEIYDLSAMRIIIQGMRGKSSMEEKIACWKVLMVLNGVYKPIGSIMRDWISVPKDNGYESLHLTFETHQYGQLEVQIRTQRMDDIAEHGGAAHWKYKCNNG